MKRDKIILNPDPLEKLKSDVENFSLGIKDEKGKTFQQWEADKLDMLDLLRHYTTQELDESPGVIAGDVRKCDAWLAFALTASGQARTFEKRGLALARLRAGEHLSPSEAKDVASAAMWRLTQARESWEAMETALKEKLWSARAILKKETAEIEASRAVKG